MPRSRRTTDSTRSRRARATRTASRASDVGKLIGSDGRPRFGVFPGAVREVNVADYRHRTAMGGPAGPFARWLGFKQFQYFGIISDAALFGCALANLRTLGLGFVYLHVPGRGMVVERSVRTPLGLGLELSGSPVAGESRMKAGALDVRFGYQDAPRRKTMRVRLGNELAVEAVLDESAAGFEPMSLCTRIGRNGWVYAHKVAGVPVAGTIRHGDAAIDLASAHAYAHHDFSAGYMRRETFWNWACLSGETVDGRPVGLNVSCGVNETSFTENCFWLDGKLHALGLCHFTYEWDRPMEPWRVASNDGRLDLTFVAEGQHAERLDLGLAASDFKQIFGRFSGTLRTEKGERLEVRDARGFVEDQYAKW